MSRLSSALSGVRVIDLTRHLPGPLATVLLSDLGAEVIKVESPAGDELRTIGPPGTRGASAYFHAINAGKRSRRVDLKTAAGRGELSTLLATADVLVESFRPGTLERLGLGQRWLRAAYPGLVVCSVSGFGAESPLRDRAGHDLNYLGLAGLLAPAQDGSVPEVPYPPLADCSAGLTAVIAILGALLTRQRDGRGCHLDLALADAALPLWTFALADVARGSRPAPAGAGELNGGAAYYRPYRTRDGKLVTLGAVEPKFWKAFCAAAGRLDWVPRQADPLPQDALRAEVAAFFAGMDLDEAIARIGPADCCFAPVLDLAEAVDAAHAAARGVLHRADGAIQALLPVRVDGEPPRPRAPFVDR